MRHHTRGVRGRDVKPRAQLLIRPSFLHSTDDRRPIARTEPRERAAIGLPRGVSHEAVERRRLTALFLVGDWNVVRAASNSADFVADEVQYGLPHVRLNRVDA